MNKSVQELIEKHILKEYKYIHNDICKITLSNNIMHSVLSGVALGDAQEHTALKRARLSKTEGTHTVDDLIDFDILSSKSSTKLLPRVEGISHKLYFNTPFLRFWFAFVSPVFKGIKTGVYKEFEANYENKRAEFINLTYIQLCKEYIKLMYKNDIIHNMDSYWDKQSEIDIVMKTKSGKIIAGNCKFNNSKIKKNELNKLKQDCERIGLKVDTFVLFSKLGFSSELKSQKSEGLKLFTIKSLRKLKEDS
ncbi:MAG: ATPase [uncultured Campylobacterales bacterium]|uniref:ATPase n=1 Tax=uncultured Campylobacterales bacterium TaxID=352960 RepID=A0A6S6TGD3_9BACT|nr:MAG: ATPase [uncultured Campylobacterales bacterium]